MRARHLILAGLAAAAMLGLATPGHADPYKWCAQYGNGWSGGGRNCGFVTWQQCMATVSGIGGYCEPNPFYSGRATTGSGRKAKKPRRD
ncbi:MAG: DUF3551 domain-containing protein [Pseudolabrys sp.]